MPAAEVPLATKAAWTVGSVLGVATAGFIFGLYRGWAPITVVRKGALIIFTFGVIVTVMPIDEVRRGSVETVAQGIEQDAARQYPERSGLARSKTLTAATKAKKLVEDSDA